MRHAREVRCYDLKHLFATNNVNMLVFVIIAFCRQPVVLFNDQVSVLVPYNSCTILLRHINLVRTLSYYLTTKLAKTSFVATPFYERIKFSYLTIFFKIFSVFDMWRKIEFLCPQSLYERIKFFYLTVFLKYFRYLTCGTKSTFFMSTMLLETSAIYMYCFKSSQFVRNNPQKVLKR